MTRRKDRGGHIPAQTKAMRRYRDSGRPEAEDYRDRERKRATARNEALSTLARRHPGEFAALYAAELKHAGLEERPRGRPPLRTPVTEEQRL
jgi:hypothetical protein